jgi:hypothetical protein
MIRPLSDNSNPPLSSSTLPVWTRLIMMSLMAAGVALAVVTLVMWRSPGMTMSSHEDNVSTVTSSTATPVPSNLSATATPTASTPSLLPNAPFQMQSSVKDISQLGLPSDGIIGTLLGTSVLLVLVGAFFPRISKVVIPGGGEIDLTPYALQAATEIANQARLRLAQPPSAQRGAAPDDVVALGARTGAATTVALQTVRRVLLDPKGYGRLLGLSDDQIDYVRTHRQLPPELWPTLAQRALDSVGFTGQE